MASRAQIKFIEDLLIDCQLAALKTRNAYLSAEIGRPIKFIDDLDTAEASKIIDDLRNIRDNMTERRSDGKNWRDGEGRDPYS